MSTVEMNSEEFYSIGHGFGLQELSLLHYIIINQKATRPTTATPPSATCYLI